MAKLSLSMPVKLGDKVEITELNFRDYSTAEDYLAFDKRGGVAQNIALIASMSGTDEALILKLAGKDYNRALKIVDAVLMQDKEEEFEKK